MVSTLDLDEKFNRVRKNYCFYLDIQDHGLARSISRRIQDIGLQQEVFLSPRVSHVVVSRAPGAAPPAPCVRRERRRADAMLERVRRAQPPPPEPDRHDYVTLTVQKAISLLDKLYDTFFAASRKSHVRLFTKHFIKIEFLDKWCRPIYKEFDEWPVIQVDDAPKEKKEPTEETSQNAAKIRKLTAGQKMTKGRRPRIKEKEKEPKGGYCEMCAAEYADAGAHRRSAHHLAFVRDANNYLALDSLIAAGGDVASFLDKTAPLNGERRSQRICNGDSEARTTRSKRSQSPDSIERSPRRNGLDDKKTRCAKKTDDDRQYYKVVGVSTKLRSSGGFAKRKDSSPTCNGAKPLVVKFRKVRKSELSILSDEAEQFMFPKRASSTSSTSSDEEDNKVLSPKRKSPAVPQPPLSLERRRQARPLALKEESSEDDSWPEDKRRRKRRGPPVTKRPKRTPCKTLALELPVEPEPKPEPEEVPPVEVTPVETPKEVSPLREDVEKCMKWEDGRLKYTPAVEQLEFAFESVPQSEPWYETFKRQDQDKVVTRNVPHYFALYSSPTPKLPYELGPLPPLQANCCALSELGRAAGGRRAPGPRPPPPQRTRRRAAAARPPDARPRKSPREHASTLAILGSAGLLHRRKPPDDTKSTASEDTVSDTHPNLKPEPLLSESQEASERLQQFLSEVFDDASDYDVSDEGIEGEAVTTSATAPDVSSLVSECDDCHLITDEMRAAADRPRGRRGKFKKKNRTGWPNKKKRVKKDSRATSVESEHRTESVDRSSVEPPDEDTVSEADTCASDAELNATAIEKLSDDSRDKTLTENRELADGAMDVDSSDKLLIDLKVVVDDPKETKEETVRRKSRSSGSEEEKELRKKRRALQGLCDWLPVVRVARVDSPAARRLRSAARPRQQRLR